MNEYEKLWDERAAYFDVDYSSYDMDIEFFKQYMNDAMDICELGSGTLRIPKLTKGCFRRFFGVDLSAEMLKKGLEDLDDETAKNVETIHSGMETVIYPTKMDLIFNMGNSFLMIQDSLKERTLANAANHLSPDGRFILEIYNPNRWRDIPQNQFVHLRTIEDRKQFVVLSYTQRIDETKRINDIVWYREEIHKTSRGVQKNVFPIQFHFLDYPDAKKLVERSFDILDLFGGFETSAFDPARSPRMIFVCKAK